MKPTLLNDETRALAESRVWFEPPEDALADPIRFMAYAFARATHKQMKVPRAYVSGDDWTEALDKARRGYRSSIVGLLAVACGAESGAAVAVAVATVWAMRGGFRARVRRLAVVSCGR